jgi:hypothetical protein
LLCSLSEKNLKRIDFLRIDRSKLFNIISQFNSLSCYLQFKRKEFNESIFVSIAWNFFNLISNLFTFYLFLQVDKRLSNRYSLVEDESRFEAKKNQQKEKNVQEKNILKMLKNRRKNMNLEIEFSRTKCKNETNC